MLRKPGTSIAHILVRDYLGFLLMGNAATLRIANLTNPAAPSWGPSITLPGNGTALDCEGNYLYTGSTSGAGNGYITVVGA